MGIQDNVHQPTAKLRGRISDLAIAGIPVYLIAKIVKIDDETLTKYYSYELSCAQPDAVARIGKVVAIQAMEGNEKSQALYLKTQGSRFGWVEKQVIETVNTDESQALKDKIKELEGKCDKDF